MTNAQRKNGFGDTKLILDSLKQDDDIKKSACRFSMQKHVHTRTYLHHLHAHACFIITCKEARHITTMMSSFDFASNRYNL